MNGKQHFAFYSIVIGILSIIETFTHYFTFKLILTLYFSFFLINPDYDLLFGIKHHRNFFTHSLLYPLTFYILFKDYINMNNADMFGVIIFMPCLIHMIGDFRIKHMLDKKEQKGSWCISFFGKRFNEKWTYVWFFANVFYMTIYIILVFTGYWRYIIEFIEAM